MFTHAWGVSITELKVRNTIMYLKFSPFVAEGEQKQTKLHTTIRKQSKLTIFFAFESSDIQQ